MNTVELDLADGLWRFANNKVWQVDAGMIGGTIAVDLAKLADGLDDFLDHIAEVATGSIIGLEGISWKLVGEGKVAFAGTVDLNGMTEEEQPGQALPDKHLPLFLVLQYQLTEDEARHAANTGVRREHQGDVVAAMSNGRQIRLCTQTSTVRVTIDEWEIARCEHPQLASDPLQAMISVLKTAGAATGAD